MTRCNYHGSHVPGGECDTTNVLLEVSDERARQHTLHGKNLRNESGTGPEFQWAAPLAGLTGAGAQRLEKELRASYEGTEAQGGRVTWAQILLEEFAEVMREDDPEQLAIELIQVAAVCVSWVEKLRDPESVIGPNRYEQMSMFDFHKATLRSIERWQPLLDRLAEND